MGESEISPPSLFCRYTMQNRQPAFSVDVTSSRTCGFHKCGSRQNTDRDDFRLHRGIDSLADVSSSKGRNARQRPQTSQSCRGPLLLLLMVQMPLEAPALDADRTVTDNVREKWAGFRSLLIKCGSVDAQPSDRRDIQTIR